ncbi:four helix bundle protein [Roseivirga sp. 4D4]|uniref:four helix bundle protein n=1 Tax=Roseivirga sp. 4D4 TaxID=1889784 RepID=UPI001112E3D8|nr:four helix bundle protein [Roseivirga sp. 4D4]
MKTFGSLKILEQGMEIVSTTHQLASKYTQTNMAGLINEISLLAIGIPSSIAASSKEDTTNAYQEGLQSALTSVERIDEKLAYLSDEEPTLDRLKCLIHLEHELIAQALGKSGQMTLKRPAKTSRLALASMKSRAPMPHIKVSQGVQGELF